MKFKPLVLLLLLLPFLYSQINITMYYIDGCSHCASTELLFGDLLKNYNADFVKKEVYYNSENRNEMFAFYDLFGHDYTGIQTPTIIVNGQALVIGELSGEKWVSLLDDCSDGECETGIYTYNSFTPVNLNSKNEEKPEQQLTLTILIGAALVDSLNPCTIAVMVMLLGVILITKGRDRTLFSGLAFVITIFVMYLLMGFGVLHAVSSAGLTNAFFIVITIMAFILSIMELNAYFNYKPGFGAVEMPMFLRPHLKTVMKRATSLSGVVAVAMVCSLFLLPCSSGPYLLVLGMLSKSVTVQGLFYLVLYNLIFVLPMLIITIAIYKGMTTVEDMTEIRNKYIKEIHLVSGIILFALFLLLIGQLLGFI